MVEVGGDDVQDAAADAENLRRRTGNADDDLLIGNMLDVDGIDDAVTVEVRGDARVRGSRSHPECRENAHDHQHEAAQRPKRNHTGLLPFILARLPLTPLQFRPQNLEVTAAGGFNKSKGPVCAPDGDLIPGHQLEALLAVESEENLVPVLHIRLDPDRGSGWNHDRAI